MNHISLIESRVAQKSEYDNPRAEMIGKAVEDINILRQGTSYADRVETPEKLARRINMNVFLAGKKNDGELLMILNQCKEKRNYSGLYYLLK